MHHVNLCVPESIDGAPGTEAEAAWLVALGYRPVEGSPEISKMATVHWFEGDDGTQIHLSTVAEHQPSPRAHTAIRLDDALDPTIAALEATGVGCKTVEFDGDRHVFAHDPAGNLWELIGPPAP